MAEFIKALSPAGQVAFFVMSGIAISIGLYNYFKWLRGM